jgi:mercuric ion transport protein
MHKRFSRLSLGGVSLPTVGLALLPKLTCPACWPAYAGLLSAMGIGFFDYTPYLMPLTALFIVIVLASLAFRAGRRHGYKPLLLGGLASLVLLAGKFYFDRDAIMYLGLGLLVSASLWNSWPRRADHTRICNGCTVPDRSAP